MTTARPHVRATWNDDCDRIIATPSPREPPRYSPTIAPSSAAGAAMRSPTNTDGSAACTRTAENIRSLPPPAA